MSIERKEYLEKLIAGKDKQLIKIVTGVQHFRKICYILNFIKENICHFSINQTFL